MNLITINEAISNGNWIYCNVTESFLSYQFHIKILSFRKLNLSEIDNPEQMKLFDFGATIWIMQLEVINLTKRALCSGEGPNNLILIDQDGFKFYVFGDTHLRQHSVFGKEIGISRFNFSKLIPKIKAVGAIPFQLPDDNEAVYSLSVKSGNIHVI